MKSNELTRLQQKALPYLLESHTIEEAAKLSGVSTKQIFNWLKQSKFKNELDRLRDQILEAAIDRLRKGAIRASEVIVATLESHNESIRLKAADQLLANFMKLTELSKFENRLTVLEQKLGG